jgi:hypothetical protein
MNGPHLDDESLSAALDNISGTPDDEAHLAGCRQCQARLGELASTAQAVAAPVPARSPEEVDAAIQRALAATPPLPARTGAAEPVDLADRRPVRRWLVATGAVAAAAVLVAGLAIGLTRSGKSSPRVASTSGPASSRSEPAGAAGPTAAIGRDLGDQSDPKELAALLTARIGGGPAAASGPASAVSSTTAPPPGALPTTNGAVPSSGEQSTCLSSAVRAAGLSNVGLGVIRMIAPLRWRGQPALAFVFERQPPATGSVGLVVGTSGCTVLTRLPM